MYRVTVRNDNHGFASFDFKTRQAALLKLHLLALESLKSKELREKEDQFTIYKY